MAKQRYLTKSRFKLASECPAKLFYTGKTDYADQSLGDSFLQALAEGGFQVAALAKCYFPGGYEVATQYHDEAVAKTNALLELDQVTIYEAAIATEKLSIRVDILVKKGNQLSIYEVKAKSFDPNGEAPFANKDGTIKADWLPYFYDLAFQKHVIKQALPQYEVSANFILVDKTARCPTDGLNQKFRLVKGFTGQISVDVSKALTDADLTPRMLATVNADAECEQIYAGKEGGSHQFLSFAQRVELFADSYISNTKIPAAISAACAACEFHTTDTDEQAGLKSGKVECWKTNLGWSDKDIAAPTVLDVWNFNKKAKMRLIEAGCIKMSQLSEEDIKPKSDKKLGLSPSERQWLQVEKEQNKDDSIWLDRENLQYEMDCWWYPLHFIDFETAMVAIPFNAGQKPYEGIAFQFSHHTVSLDGTIKHSGEYLNTKNGVFPNYDFVRALKAQLQNDSGTIFRYSNHENAFLNLICKQLEEDPSEIPDRDALCAFIKSITQVVAKKSPDKRIGKRNMVDMLEIVKRYYYDPATNGSNSIKQVLPAILNSSKFLQEKYSKPIYGAADGIKSLNFKDWQWVKLESGKVVDPYKTLPKMFQDISANDVQISSSDDELRDGGAALTAYARMQFSEMADYEREELQKALLKYCELDTMAMVMIYEGLKDMLQQGE